MQVHSKDAGFLPEQPGCRMAGMLQTQEALGQGPGLVKIHSHLFPSPRVLSFPFSCGRLSVSTRWKTRHWCLLSFMACSFWPRCFQAPNSRPSHLAQLGTYLVMMPLVMTTGVGLHKNSPRMRWWEERETAFKGSSEAKLAVPHILTMAWDCVGPR